MTVSRRDVVTGLLSGGALALEAGGATAAGAGRGIRLGPARPFSDQGLDDQARALAGRPFRARPAAWEGGLAALDFDALGAIRFRPEAALWRGDARIGAVEFFHPGKYARAPVAIHEVDAGVAREVLYARSLFDIPPGNPARRLPADLGFAGFRVMNPAAPGDWIAYQGASYFRAADPFNQYGLSARGLAIDTAVAEPEEFPAFTAFWLERAPEGLVVHALLEGPSVAGAYRIEHRRGPAGLVQTLKARLYFRRAVQRLGLAPLTSMFWYGPADHARASDWRPQVHDSDGLSMWTGVGERIWRPLGNPPRVVTNALRDAGPKGFGLMQRDRAFADYQDDGAFYNRRPSAWVEPLDGGDPAVWGLGSAQLVEIPTDDETDDNIVAFWTPQRPVEAGDSLAYAYRLHWTAEEPIPLGVAQVVATRVGRAGRPGQPPTPGARKYVVDFEGGRLAALSRRDPVQAVITASLGEAILPAAYPVVGTGRWRLMFDIATPAGATIDIRAFLRLGGDSLTETWLAQAFG